MAFARASSLTLWIMLITTLAHSTISAEVCAPNPKDALLARYIFELRNNRQAECEPGGDFVTRPADIKYTVTSFCPKVETATDTLYTISYSFIDCDNNQPDELTLKARVRKCEDATSVLQQPVNLLEAKVADVPAKFACPAGATSLSRAEAALDLDFTLPWQLTHAAENAFKWNLTVVDPSLKPECDSYLGTTMDHGCFDNINRVLSGYATLTAECVEDGTTTKRSVYIRAQVLPGGRERCPEPEILKGYSGFHSNFTFTTKPALTAAREPEAAYVAVPIPAVAPSKDAKPRVVFGDTKPDGFATIKPMDTAQPAGFDTGVSVDPAASGATADFAEPPASSGDASWMSHTILLVALLAAAVAWSG